MKGYIEYDGPCYCDMTMRVLSIKYIIVPSICKQVFLYRIFHKKIFHFIIERIFLIWGLDVATHVLNFYIPRYQWLPTLLKKKNYFKKITSTTVQICRLEDIEHKSMKQVSYSGKYSFFACGDHQSHLQFSFVVRDVFCPSFLHV